MLASLDFSFKIIALECFNKTKQMYFLSFFLCKIMKTNQICMCFIFFNFLNTYLCVYVSNSRTLNSKRNLSICIQNI